MIIKNALVYTEDHKFEKKDVRIEDERIAEIAENGQITATDEDVIDGEGMYAIPGLVDIHFHGAVGYDFCQASKEELLKIAEYEAKNGVLAICPATMSYNEEKMCIRDSRNGGGRWYRKHAKGNCPPGRTRFPVRCDT